MILVTGGTGFLGTHLLRALVKREEPVRALKRSWSRIFPEEDLLKKIEWVDGDVLDMLSLEDAMEGCEKVYHCAAKVSFLPKDREKLLKVNAGGTANIVNVALYKNIRKLLHVSSVAAIGKRTDGGLSNEDDEWEDSKHNSNYSISKYLAEREVWRGMAEGLSAVIINPSVILGDGNWQEGTPRFFLNVWKGMPMYPTGGTGMVAVQDVVQLMILLMENDISNERFIVSAEDQSYEDLFFLIADLLGKRRPYLRATPWVMELLWRIDRVRSVFFSRPLITREVARIARYTLRYDHSKIKIATGFQFTPIQTCLEEASKLFLEDMRAGKIK